MNVKIERLLVIGDIHGKWERFEDVYRKAEFNPEKDMLVFLGDYLDRGDNPIPVMDWVMEHYGSPNMIFLRGNHEQMFYESLRPEEQVEGLVDFRLESPKSTWLNNGGMETYKALKKTGRGEDLISEWLRLIEKLPLYAEVEVDGQKYWFIHADCNSEISLDEQSSKKIAVGEDLSEIFWLSQW